jgi:hypothetical protein
MRQRQMVVMFCLVFIGLLSTACSGSNSPASSEANRVATRVAEELSVAATLTALAPPGEKPTTPTPTTIVAEVTAPPAQTAVATPVQIATEVTAPTGAPPAASCRAITAGLNLRPGPGTVYNPPLAALARNTELRPLSFVARGFPSGQWIEVQAVSNGRQGWVGAGQQFVACKLDLASLPAGVPPPTPTPAPTATRLPTAPAQVAVVPVDGSDGNKDLGNDRGVNQGRNLLLYSPRGRIAFLTTDSYAQCLV